jgi:hypothetical protein
LELTITHHFLQSRQALRRLKEDHDEIIAITKTANNELFKPLLIHYRTNIFYQMCHVNYSVKQLTFDLIHIIEEMAGKKALDFSEEGLYSWMDFISDLEDQIDPKLTESDIQRALDQISKFKEPSNKTS